MTLEEILTEWSNDSEIKSTALDKASLETSKLHSKYIQMLFATRRHLNDKKSELKLLKFMKQQWYNGNLSKQQMDDLKWPYDPWAGGTKPLKAERSVYLEADMEVMQVSEQVQDYQEIVDALTEILQSIKWRHQSIKNTLDYMKFVAGV